MFAFRVPVFTLAFVVATLSVFAFASPAVAQPADQAAIDRTIELGVSYLKKQQKSIGYWGEGTGPGSGKGWGVGYTALAGLTLVECGVPVTDPGLKNAARLIRANVSELESTYEIGLAILFLDRMKDKTDKRLIQWLGGRLIAGQTTSGGWGYKVPKYSELEAAQLIAALRKMTPPSDDDKKGKTFDLEKARYAAVASVPLSMKRHAVFYDPGAMLPVDPEERSNEPYFATTDNSNTHFAMLGIWTSRKYDVPTDRTCMLFNRRFRTSQGSNGTWSYRFAQRGANGSLSHTCIALLGIAIGHVVDPQPDVKPDSDPVIVNAFVALSKSIGEPVGDTRNRPKIQDVGGMYYLWVMERIAILYDLRKLGNKDWYQWGAEILLCHQKGDGSWESAGTHTHNSPIVTSCFALLFLRRANLMPDLSKRLVVEPGAITKIVEEKITPKPEPPKEDKTVIEVTPPKKEEKTVIDVIPQPTPAPKAPAPTTAPQPQVSPPLETQEVYQPRRKPEKESSSWWWILLGITTVGFIALGSYYYATAKGEKHKKKKKKKLKEVEVEE